MNLIEILNKTADYYLALQTFEVFSNHRKKYNHSVLKMDYLQKIIIPLI